MAWNDNTIVAEVTLSGQEMNILGHLCACCPPPLGDKLAWAKSEVLRYLNDNHPYATWVNSP